MSRGSPHSGCCAGCCPPRGEHRGQEVVTVALSEARRSWSSSIIFARNGDTGAVAGEIAPRLAAPAPMRLSISLGVPGTPTERPPITAAQKDSSSSSNRERASAWRPMGPSRGRRGRQSPARGVLVEAKGSDPRPECCGSTSLREELDRDRRIDRTPAAREDVGTGLHGERVLRRDHP